MGIQRNIHRAPAGKLEGRRLLGINGCVWEDNIKKDFKDME